MRRARADRQSDTGMHEVDAARGLDQALLGELVDGACDDDQDVRTLAGRHLLHDHRGGQPIDRDLATRLGLEGRHDRGVERRPDREAGHRAEGLAGDGVVHDVVPLRA